MNGYVCFYKNERLEIHADTSYEAQQKAMGELQSAYPRRKIKSYDITVVLAERNGQQVTHTAVD